MPSAYAHYRFGTQIVGALPAEAAKTVRRCRQLFDAGLQGPDFFFYYEPILRAGAGKLGSVFHRQTGKEFFSRAAEHLRQLPSEVGTAYLFGVLGHYALDSACHPLIRRVTEDGKIGHTELEMEFDRFLLESDGIESPCTYDLSQSILLTRGDCAAISGFYPGVSPFAVRHSFRNMKGIHRLLAKPNRAFLERSFRIAGAHHMVMPRKANPNCAHLNPQLQTRYREALSRYPVLAAQLAACIREGRPLGEDFAPNFG